MTQDAAATDTHDDARPSAETGSSENAVATRILLTILVALVLWGLCVFFWGVPGLYLPALALVPVVWIALIAITIGR
ncbi:hypothetical protein DC366_10505 [Pelagivirga sediminicola]|uniref:Uncharacterized protein n=1 Tax=Pelagivirga sediminicola TaxID=2170575 RepID=A0A2T7G6L3_9RHOB|nr:hypothetical protein [Pelagivirga sediminicola]PVA10075.1 hypothetical protein DC366_10505 [Pelagivirga sediminicola]